MSIKPTRSHFFPIDTTRWTRCRRWRWWPHLTIYTCIDHRSWPLIHILSYYEHIPNGLAVADDRKPPNSPLFTTNPYPSVLSTQINAIIQSIRPSNNRQNEFSSNQNNIFDNGPRQAGCYCRVSWRISSCVLRNVIWEDSSYHDNNTQIIRERPLPLNPAVWSNVCHIQ